MTLIISHAFPQWVSIASDRMLSVNGNPVRGKAIKLVFYFNDIVFGFTGIAYLPNREGKCVPTSEWLFEVLAEVPRARIWDVCEIVRLKSESVIKLLARRGPILPLAFLGSGWELGSDIHSTKPAYVIISNFHDPDNGSAHPRTPSTSFVTLRSPSDFLYASTWVGLDRTQDEIDWLETRIHAAVEQKCTAKTIVHLVKESIRQTARRTGHRVVGEDVLTAIIPRTTPLAEYVSVVSWDQSNRVILSNGSVVPPYDPATSSFIGRFPRGNDVGVTEFPHIASPGVDSVGVQSNHDGGYRCSSVKIMNTVKGEIAGILSPRSIHKKPTRAQKRSYIGNKIRRRQKQDSELKSDEANNGNNEDIPK